MSRPWATPDRLFWFGLVLAAVVYSITLQADFIFDDVHLILLNDTLDSWSKWRIAFTQHVWEFHQPPAGARHYRPGFVLWLLANKRLFGDIAPWWHLTSLLLHLIATTLLYRVAVRLLKNDSTWTPAVAALLFAIHPVHIESVAWISASTDLLAAIFLLSSFLCYLRFRETLPESPALLSLAVLFAALAILCKETAAVFPAVIFFYEWFADQTTSLGRYVTRSLPFVAVVVIYALVRRVVMPLPAGSSTDADLSTILTSLPLVAAEYAQTLLWPFRLSFFYDPAVASQWTIATGFAVLLLVILLIALWRFARSVPMARLPLAWMLLFAAPPLAAIAVFTRDNWVHDRHMYLPSVGFCLLAAILLARLEGPWRTFAVAAIALVFTAGLALQLPRFGNELTLYEHAMRRSPDNLEMRLAYADALQLHGRPADALQEYERIVELAPDSVEALTYLGIIYDDAGRSQDARQCLERAAKLAAPGSNLRMLALFRLGSVELRLGDLTAAEVHLRAAVAMDPHGWNYHALLAETLRQQGSIAEAEAEMKLEAAARQASTAQRARRK